MLTNEFRNRISRLARNGIASTTNAWTAFKNRTGLNMVPPSFVKYINIICSCIAAGALVNAYYNREPNQSYYDACSNTPSLNYLSTFSMLTSITNILNQIEQLNNNLAYLNTAPAIEGDSQNNPDNSLVEANIQPLGKQQEISR